MEYMVQWGPILLGSLILIFLNVVEFLHCGFDTNFVRILKVDFGDSNLGLVLLLFDAVMKIVLEVF